MSYYQPSSEYEPSSPDEARTRLGYILIGVVACLIVAIILASFAGLGWIAYTGSQDGHATATSRAQQDNTAPTSQDGDDNVEGASQTQIVLPPPGWTLLINDQFALNSNGWTAGSREEKYGDGAFFLENQRYRVRVEANSDEGLAWWVNSNFYHQTEDLYLSVKCRLVGGDPASSACGLAYRINDGSYYYFVISEDLFMAVVLVHPDEWSYLVAWEHTDLVQPDQLNQLAVLAEGEHYSFFINGEIVSELDDNQLSRGETGVIVNIWGKNKAEFEFDDFRLYEPGR